MTIALENVLPEALADQDTSQSEIWKNNLNIPTGFTQVIAPSGKGKSTFVQVLYGNRKDYAGSVSFDQENIRRLSPKKWAGLRQKVISIVFQELMLFPELNGWENITIKSSLTKYYDQPTIEVMAGKLGLTETLMKKKCGFMSFGERQRVAIVRAMVQPFEWLLLDEPFSHLDNDNTKVACELIESECRKRSASLILTSLDGGDFLNYDNKLRL